MACYNPLACLRTYYSDGDVVLTKFKKSTEDYRKYLSTFDFSVSDEILKHYKTSVPVCSDVLEVPCGHCVGCRITKSLEWATRLVCETKYSDSAWFVTFTYDDDHLPKSASGVPTVWKYDKIQKWKKAFLEQIYRDSGFRGVRFYMVSEYGDKYARPHYHAIFFNIPDKLVKPYFWQRKDIGAIYRSEYFEKAWQFGFVALAPVNFRTAAYVGRYCLKKQYGKDKEKYGDRVPVWSHGSTDPGIGKAWFDDHVEDLKKFDSVPVKIGEKAFAIKPPKYFDKKLAELDPEAAEVIKILRKQRGEDLLRSKLSQTDKTLDELRIIECVSKLEKIERLKRSYEGT